MILDDTDFNRVKHDECYLDLLRHILTRFSCMFVGFSFMDPAIDHILQFIAERLGPNYPANHLAILPADADNTLKNRLCSFNIEPVLYDPSAGHSTLWNGIAETARRFSPNQKSEKPHASFPLQSTHTFLATAYARAKIGTELGPLRDTIVDGIVLGLISQNQAPMTLGNLAQQLKNLLSLSGVESEQLTLRRITYLRQLDLCHIDGDMVSTKVSADGSIQAGMIVLIDGVADRLVARHAQQANAEVRRVIGSCVEETLLARGWDLGARFSGARAAEAYDIQGTLDGAMARHGNKLAPRQRRAIVLACFDLLERPATDESHILADMGRLAFGLQLVMHAPCSSIAHGNLLPERVYLDANVAMPMVVAGHPYQPVYADTFRRLGEAARAAGLGVTVFVARDFLNEIIAHKNIARREVDMMGLDDPEELRRHIMYYGAQTTNVFVGAFGSWVGRLHENIRFDDFLREAAPYETVPELTAFLDQKGIQTVPLGFSDEEMSDFYRIKNALEDAYEMDPRSMHDRKSPILIEHEARQLARLGLDAHQGFRSVFVTADERLRGLLKGSILSQMSSATMSHVSFVQLIDLLVGVEGDPVSLSRLYWGGGTLVEQAMILNYYTNLALGYREEAMAMTLPEVLGTLVPEAVNAAKQFGIMLFPGGSVESKARTALFLDRFEDRFFANMADVIRKRYPDEYNSAEQARRLLLEERIRKTTAQISKFEVSLAEGCDTQTKAFYERMLEDLRIDLEVCRNELKNLQGV